MTQTAFFTMSKSVQGSADHALNCNGVTWHFASGENRQMFERNPDKYAPQYGGHCAYAMSKGYIAPTVPEAWTIYKDRLYLNFSLRARELWLQDVPGNIALGDANWPKLKEKKEGHWPSLKFRHSSSSLHRSINFFACGLNIVRSERTRSVSCLATPRCGAACVTFHAGTVAHQCVVAAIAAGFAFVALHFRLGAFVHCGHRGRNRF